MNRVPTGRPAWLVQRASAVYMLLFLIFFLGSLWLHPVHGHAGWVQWIGHPALRAAVTVFFTALFAHMWVGLRDVLLDYAQPVRLRPYLLIVLAMVLSGLAVWAAWIVLRPFA